MTTSFPTASRLLKERRHILAKLGYKTSVDYSNINKILKNTTFTQCAVFDLFFINV